MRKRALYACGPAVLALAAIGLGAALVSGSSAAPLGPAAKTQRTFVSTSGSDANPCTRAEPCRNFVAALATTLPGGEVVALDSGGYGVVTITQSVTIAGAPGAHVAITAFSTNAVTVNAGATDTVVLRNLYLTGLDFSPTGIVFEGGGSLHVESVVATGFIQGLHATASDAELFVIDSQFRHSGDHGVLINGPSAEVENSRADANGNMGFVFVNGTVAVVRRSAATSNASFGFFVTGGARAVIQDSVVDRNNSGVIVGEGSVVNLTGDVLSNNANAGLLTGSGALATIGGSTVTGNPVGLDHNDGTLESYGDNLVRGNGTNTDGTITTVGKT